MNRDKSGYGQVRGVSPALIAGARRLRDRSTDAESVLWEAVRGRRLEGLKFRRQYALGPYVLDLCCPERRLVIELNGPIHDTQQAHDEARTQHLEAYGYTVMRFRNEDVLNHLPIVLERIAATANAKNCSPLPISGGGEQRNQ